MNGKPDDKSKTTDQVRRYSEDDTAGYASPPCFMHELDPSYLGYLSPEDTLALLNELLEAVRAESRLMRDIESLDSHRGLSALFRDLRTDQARFNVMLMRHIERLGGTPSEKTGALGAPLSSDLPMERQLHEFNAKQRALYARLETTRLQIHEDDLREDLTEMLESREQIIQRCAGVAKG